MKKENTRLKRQGVEPNQRQKKPTVDLNYPSKQQLALHLLLEFATNFPQIKIQIADVIPLRPSSKHMSVRNLGKLEPSQSLKYRAA